MGVECGPAFFFPTAEWDRATVGQKIPRELMDRGMLASACGATPPAPPVGLWQYVRPENPEFRSQIGSEGAAFLRWLGQNR